MYVCHYQLKFWGFVRLLINSIIADETTRVFESPFSDFREESNGSDRQGTTLVATVSRRLYKAVGGR